MNSVQSLYSIGIALCLFSSGIVNAKSVRAGQRIPYFTVYLALESMCFVFELLVAHPATPLKALWLGALMGTSLLIAPCLWLAIKENVEGVRPPPTSIGWRAPAVILTGVVLTLPLLETAHFGTDFVNPDRVEPTLFEPVIHAAMLMCLALFAVQVPYYLWRCRQLILQSQAAQSADATSNAPSRRWLQMPLLVVGTTWLLGVVRTLTGAFSQGTEEFFAWVAFLDVSVTVGAVYLIVKAVACQWLPMQAPVLRESGEETSSRESRYAKSPLHPAIRTRIVQKLAATFDAEEIYRDARLSLGSLSRHINENEHYVSQVLNQELATTFYELVNRHRIERAKQLLLASPDRSVLEIALAVGFNAKSTFNTAFRRYTAMTPSEFRSADVRSSGVEPPHDPPR